MVAHYSLPLANPSSVDTWTDHMKLVLWQSEAMKRTVICVLSLAWYTMSTMMMTVFSYSAGTYDRPALARRNIYAHAQFRHVFGGAACKPVEITPKWLVNHKASTTSANFPASYLKRSSTDYRLTTRSASFKLTGGCTKSWAAATPTGKRHALTA